MNEVESLLILNAVKGLGNAGTRKLINHYGCATNVLSMRGSQLRSDSIISEKIIQNILNFSKDKFLKTEYNLMNKRQVKVITLLDDDYPALLREIPDAPMILYVKGELPSKNQMAISIVGSRRASFYGRSTSEKFSICLVELGFNIVSGMALGIDTAAHNGALKVFGTTVAVLGCGLNNVYPLENSALLDKISESGAVISEYPMQTPPYAFNFPRRNRIISGLSLGVIVVEAAQRSGALITADCALEQGREVFAVPGNINQASSFGSHNLIKQGAKLVTNVEDILVELEPVLTSSVINNSKRSSKLSGCFKKSENDRAADKLNGDLARILSNEERLVIDQLTDRPVHIDELTQNIHSTMPVMSILLQLELKQLIKQLPGKMFIR